MAEPKIRFKQNDGTSFPAWENNTIGHYLQIRDEKQTPSESAPLMAFIAYQGVADKGDRYDRSFLVKSDDKKYKRTEFNDFIYSSNNLDVGSIGLNKYGSAVISVVYEIFKCKENCIPDCINALLQMPQSIAKMLKYRQGALYGQYKIPAEDFLSIRIDMPCLEEQKKIADFLSSVDEVITASEEEVANLETQKKAVMKKIFSQEVRFKKANGTDFPEWEEARFGDTVTIERGGSPRPIESYITEGDGLNWVKIGDAPKYGNYITSTAQRIIPEGLRKTRQVFVGDLILSNSMSFGKPYIMGIDGCIHDGWLLIRNDQELYDLMYLCFLLGSDYMLKQYKSLAGGSAVNNLNKDLVAGTTVFIPCLAEQRLIADFLSDFDEAIAAAKKELELWKELKKGLLQQMFV